MRRLDRDALRTSTVLALGFGVLVFSMHVGIAAAFTDGSQPVGTVADLPASPTADAWDDAPSRDVTLSKQQMAYPFGGGSTDGATVQTLTNETHVAVRMTWQDPTVDANTSGPRHYSDAAAVMLFNGEMPPITMGSGQFPVNIWYWRASWQHGTRPSGGDMYVYPHPDAETQPGRAAGNPLSADEFSRYGQNYYARGFGTLTYADSQPVTANGERTDEGWSVVFVRERTTAGSYDASLSSNESLYVAFAVWNGSAGERTGQKSITLQFLRLDPGTGKMSAVQTGSGNDGTGDSAGTVGATGLRLLQSAESVVTTTVVGTIAVFLFGYWSVRRR